MFMRPSGGILTNSGMFTARLAAVEFSMRIAGLSLPSASRWVKNICVYGDRLFDEKTSQRPFGEKLCHEFICEVLALILRAVPPSNGTMYSSLSGRINCPLRHFTKTIHRPSDRKSVV